jgi:hypothetical protein
MNRMNLKIRLDYILKEILKVKIVNLKIKEHINYKDLLK